MNLSLDALGQAPSAELYRLYLILGKMLDEPNRTLEVRQRLHLGTVVNYVGDDPMGPLPGRVIELRNTQAVIEDSSTRRRWAVLYAAIVPDSDGAPSRREPERAPPIRSTRDEFFVGDAIGFTDRYLHERIGTIVRLNQKTASIACSDSEGHWRMSYAPVLPPHCRCLITLVVDYGFR